MTLDRKSRRPFFGSLFVGLLLLPLLLIQVGCESSVVLREHGDNAYRGQRYADAESYYTRALKLRPNNWRAQYGLGKTYLAVEKPLKAEGPLEEAYLLRDEHLETPAILDRLAESYYQQGNRTLTLRSMLQEATDRYQTPHDFLRQADYMERTGDLDAAVVAYRKACFFTPDGDSDPFMQMADFYERVGDEANAVQALRFAYYMDPETEGIEQRFRAHGIVPGPTVGLKPPRKAKVKRGVFASQPTVVE